ncbi:ribosomal protein S18 acetylase RimI-like enzyme [Saccharothrix tamanrassetensis]|uniref:Ribosomal protein S18 acetylase RimI-like enzyme n=1 Tax=Saccharothrix tamanrassetensis TaxID=1051531 RepID=A0A841CJR7_9PSEU|nr:GNAT family N-acetyltransferase [Saccharothrix tamanrassetensis]MBB5957731.1 ribosomal protein S18 acetylase RimI-like enzyme [Saccharothrix tamanrassetensis]
MKIDLTWPSEADERLRAEVHEVLHAVVAVGGAIGWQSPPGRDQTDQWLDRLLARTRVGDAALVLALVDGVVRGTASWQRPAGEVFVHRAELGRVTAHPSARGLGLGSLLVSAVVENARAAGLEILTLGVRGNNHGAIELYEQLGFREWGRLPNAIAVGDVRFDDVQMALPLGFRDGVVLHGSAAGGLGASPRRGVGDRRRHGA